MPPLDSYVKLRWVAGAGWGCSVEVVVASATAAIDIVVAHKTIFAAIAVVLLLLLLFSIGRPWKLVL